MSAYARARETERVEESTFLSTCPPPSQVSLPGPPRSPSLSKFRIGQTRLFCASVSVVVPMGTGEWGFTRSFQGRLRALDPAHGRLWQMLKSAEERQSGWPCKLACPMQRTTRTTRVSKAQTRHRLRILSTQSLDTSCCKPLGGPRGSHLAAAAQLRSRRAAARTAAARLARASARDRLLHAEQLTWVAAAQTGRLRIKRQRQSRWGAECGDS